MSDAKVGQAVQYFDSRGYGPFAAIVLAVTEASDAAPEDSEEGSEDFSGSTDAAAAGTVTLEYAKVKHGHVTKAVRDGIPAEGSDAHTAATEAIPEGAEVCGLPKKARFFRAI